MEDLKKRITHRMVGDIRLIFESDIYAAEPLDTAVYLNGEALCWIAGNTIEQFVDDFAALIKKYRI